MTRHLAGTLLALTLAACSGQASHNVAPAIGVAATPASVAGQNYSADATYQAAQAQRNAAELAAIDATARAAQVTAQHQAAVDAINMEGTRTAIEREDEQTRAAIVAENAQGTADANATVSARATADQRSEETYRREKAMAEAEAARRAEQIARTNRRADAFTAFIFGALISITLFGMFLLWLRIDSKNSRPDIVQYPGVGVVLLVPVPEPGLLGLLLGRRTVRPRPLLPAGDVIDVEPSSIRGAIHYTANGDEQQPVMLGNDSNPERTNRELARWLLREARDYLDETGGDRTVLPGHRHLPLHAEEWTRAKDMLVANRIIKPTEERKRTEFHDGWDVDTALRDITNGLLDFSPARVETVS